MDDLSEQDRLLQEVNILKKLEEFDKRMDIIELSISNLASNGVAVTDSMSELIRAHSSLLKNIDSLIEKVEKVEELISPINFKLSDGNN